ncbi:YcnI family copper-binding membrane protein [Castellaniella sp. UC4442_H9]|jgi:uncharacterized protein YcnI|nr:YcnI family protein [Castellaniella sp.]
MRAIPLKFVLATGLAASSGLAMVPAAQAHITLETRQAPAGGYYKAVVRVPHGCKGSDTTAVRVQIPDGVLDVKPMPKPGWRLEVKQGGYDHPQTLNGAKVDRGVREISWSGGDLPDAYYDEFIFRAYLSSSLKAGDTLYFPTIQECKQGMTRWIEKTDSDDESSDPAPHLKLTAPSSSGHHHK